ncbi:MAG: hypothetical protein OER86_00610 [Phycisphaerae bacterium]|nr:hypothetical protein [Phycisphaerae bacterium]
MNMTDGSRHLGGGGRPGAPGSNGDFDVGGLFRSDATRKKLLGAFVEFLGGPDVLRWMQKHYGEGYSYYQIGEWAGEATSTVRYRVRKAAKVMKRHDLFPDRWSRIDQKKKPNEAANGRRRSANDENPRCATFVAHVR